MADHNYILHVKILRVPDDCTCWKNSMIITLAGGVGAARFLDGLTQTVRPKQVYVVGNTCDDTEIYGLHISPDLDTVMYTLVSCPS